MTTRADLRAEVRRRLEDVGVTPLWDDATLNGMLADAIRAIGSRFPEERTLSVMVAEGATSVSLASAVAERTVARVVDPTGEAVPRARGPVGTGAAAQEWWSWAGEVWLAQPATGGTWAIHYLGGRTAPVDDVSALDLEPEEEGIAVALACAAVLRRRAVEDAKRGIGRGGDPVARLAEQLTAEAERLTRARLRRARGAFLDVAPEMGAHGRA